VPAGDGEIGLLLSQGETATLFAHPKAARAPNGTGDLVTASFGAGLIEGLTPAAAAERAARAAAEAAAAARAWNCADLPLVAIAERLVRPAAAVRIERL
jgi:pyridoxine kinase